jgi:hypothetical protein
MTRMPVTSDAEETSRRRLLLLAATGSASGIAAAMVPGAAVAQAEKPMLMFVQLAEDMKLDASGKLRLVNVSPQTLYFADRPVRLAGHITMDNYLKEWTSKAGADNFGKDPPNAALSVYEPGQPDSTLAVIEIRNPKVEGKDLVYETKLISGKLPAAGGQTSLFIDWIGVGGGVGPGFHGVGVGYRGAGWR